MAILRAMSLGFIWRLLAFRCDFRQNPYNGALCVPVGHQSASNIHKSDVGAAPIRQKRAVQTVRLPATPAHKHPVNRMTQPLFRHRYEEPGIAHLPAGINAPYRTPRVRNDGTALYTRQKQSVYSNFTA